MFYLTVIVEHSLISSLYVQNFGFMEHFEKKYFFSLLLV